MLTTSTCNAESESRRERVLNNLQVIDFANQRQTGKSAPLAERMEFYKTPGVSLVVIDDTAIDWSHASGLLKASEPAQVTEGSVFQAGSVSKFVAAVLVLRFVEEGLLDLNADVNRYLTSWKVPENEFTGEKKVTLGYLLSHQAGMPSFPQFEQESGKPDPTLPQMLNGERPALNPSAVPCYEPGSQWAYSNIGYAVIQLVLEDLTGKRLQQIAVDMLFGPLGMRSSSFSYPLTRDLKPDEAWPHDSQGQPRPPEQEGPARAVGGLMTTPGDMAKLVLEVMKAYQGDTTRIISPETARLMVSRQVRVPTEALGVPLSEGLGVFIDDTTDEVCFVHPGHNSPGTTFIMMAYPAMGKGAVIAVNGNVGDRLYLEVIASLAQEYGWPSGQPFKQ
jgi:CubicO group peptidase (beta-lactamase class C family)